MLDVRYSSHNDRLPLMTSSMEEFQVTVYTAAGPTSGTYSSLWIALIGSEGETLPQFITSANQHLLPGSVCEATVRSTSPLGLVVLVRLRLEPRPGFPDLPWECCRVGVQRLEVGGGGPRGGEAGEIFPCGRWLTSAEGEVELRTRTVCLLSSETELKLRDHRVKEMQNNRLNFGWRVFMEGAPHCVDVASVSQLGPNLSYTRQSPGINQHYRRGFTDRAEPWRSFEELDTFFTHNGRENHIAKYVQTHWREDAFFGYQCQNGCNPLMIRQTHLLPPNMAVTSHMLRPFLPETSTLEQELEKGTIFLLDYEVLEGVPANVINGRQQYLSAPLCLLHLDQQGQLKPVAIQLQQHPGPQNPVFLPSDPMCDWLLAKMWVRCADFQCHQLASHFLKTHLLGEVYCTATLRQLPEVHPLFQLLMPHIRSTLQINIQARASILAPNGVFDKAIGCGLASLPAMLSRSSARLTYRSLCVPDDLEDRGLASLPLCYYAQDALRVWGALHRFVLQMMELYYHGDQCVEQDSELQSWIRDVYTHGFLHNPQSGCPQSFHTVTELSKFVTMVIFSCSALHSAVNFSQMDFDLWMPNCPPSMPRPPPQTKGTVTQDNLLSFLPEVNSTCNVIITLSLLSAPAADYVPLCQYREPFFKSGPPCRLVEEVQAELRAISDDIANRNRKLELPYPYLSPDLIENSTAI